MPNVSNPNGLQPVKSITGAPYNGQGNMYWIPAADTSSYQQGDLVQTIANSDINGVPGISKCAASATRIRGVVVAVYALPPNGTPSLVGTPLQLEYVTVPATKARDYYVLVADDPQLLFSVIDDGTTVLGQTAANKNINFTVAVGNFAYSATVLTNSTVATTSTLPLRIVGVEQLTNNNVTLASTRWLVKINQHDLLGNSAGI